MMENTRKQDKIEEINRRYRSNSSLTVDPQTWLDNLCSTCATHLSLGYVTCQGRDENISPSPLLRTRNPLKLLAAKRNKYLRLSN